MKINAIELINVLIVMWFIFVMKRQRDVTTLLLILFAYGSLHFAFAAIFLASNDSYNLLNAIHYEGSGVLARLSTMTLLVIVFVLLGQNARRELKNEKKILWHFSLVMAVVLIGYFLSFRLGDGLQFKNVVSIQVMLALLFMGFVGLRDAVALNSKSYYAWIVIGLIIFGFTNIIAIYEVFSHRSWAGTLESSGAMVYRASSILFNPNLYAFWACLVYLGCAYGMHTYTENRKLMLWGMVLASIAIYFSGSRSAGYLLLVVLIIPTLLMKERVRWVPLMVLPLTMLTVYVGAAWLAPALTSRSEGWHEIALLGERFAAAPIYLIKYILRLTGVPIEIVLSIEGRFVGEGRDSGWLVLYQDVGWLGLFSVILASCMLVVWGVRAYIAHPSPSSVYALAILFYCLLTGFVMRFQIFPVWLFISIVLIPCLVFWRQLSLPVLHIRG